MVVGVLGIGGGGARVVGVEGAGCWAAWVGAA
jgi:hypothetical protein